MVIEFRSEKSGHRVDDDEFNGKSRKKGIDVGQKVEQMVRGMERVDEDAVQKRGTGERKLFEAAEWKRELRMEVKGRGGVEEELETNLGLSCAALSNQFGNGVARDAATQESV